MAKSPDVFNIPLDAALIHAILLGSRCLLDSLTVQQLQIQSQYPRNLSHFQIITSCYIIANGKDISCLFLRLYKQKVNQCIEKPQTHAILFHKSGALNFNDRVPFVMN